MKCHNCSTTMSLARTANSERSTTQWYKCPICSAQHMTTRLLIDEQKDDADLDPYSHFIASSSQHINANDENNFQLRQQEFH